ncbi:MAG: hypothetical protein JW860_14530 [Sedimentisphaerales bacterium]|nr:hypothetical protein [Sedimentisphaerales bacterium]
MMRKIITLTFILSYVLWQGGCDKKDSQAESEISQCSSPPMTKQVALVQGIPEPLRQPDEFTSLRPAQRPPRDLVLVSHATTAEPDIDGRADSIWNSVPPLTTLDYSSQRPIELRSLHTQEYIYVLASYPDSAPSVSHKSWFWDHKEQIYKPGNDREDMFTMKWLMSGESLYLNPSLSAPHTADVWFWKAYRTNPSGTLDDKKQELTLDQQEDALAMNSDTYGTLYLKRVGDAGTSAYSEEVKFDYLGDFVPRFYARVPAGSRADVRGKGVWSDGRWTIEIQRKLKTDHDDDVQFHLNQSCLFVVSLYEMAGSEVDQEWYQPLYRTGDGFDRITLKFE